MSFLIQDAPYSRKHAGGIRAEYCTDLYLDIPLGIILNSESTVIKSC